MNLRRPHAAVLAAVLATGFLAVVPPAVAGVPGDPPVPGPGDVIYDNFWQPGMQYKAGELVGHHRDTYRCLQSHTSLPEWAPDLMPALWQQV
ncbi:carbohydrate-binding protein [Streptosporangium sp. NPDC001559]|uniref:carbohydrate-binding protein n=1 Tax=Streptosporangium sp. NPDC001559 TaxID=3366187 RepID=UPI0036E7F95E